MQMKKTIKREDIEIMAPIGSYESLTAAIQGGADAVYFGIERLNMRAKSANNFTTEDLKKIVATAKENNIKTYLTLNTVIYDKDLALMREIVDTAKASGLTAIIASDHSVLNYANEKKVEVHISTQVNISNIEAVKFYSKFSDVVVLARELNLKQVKEITQAIEREDIRGVSGNLLRVEMFVHGALCMAVSGKCYLSLHENNVSANRGSCQQTCRKSYLVKEKETGNELEIDNEYIMSPKDLCTIGFIDKIIGAGVSVFKIEGRARPPEYVQLCCKCYDEAIKSYINGTYTEEKIKEWKKKLSTVFNRGFWDGYYLGRRLGEWNNEYGSKATKKKRYIGKGTNYFSKIKVAEFKLEASDLSVGDEVLIIGPTTGVINMTIKEIRVDDRSVQTAPKRSTISIRVDEKIRRADKMYQLYEVEF